VKKFASAVIAGLVMSVVLVALLAGPAPAGTSSVDAELTIDKHRTVLFVQTSLPRADAERVYLNVLAPSPDGREVWQWCRLGYVGPGTYRCGIDISKSTRARTLEGDWAANLRLDGRLLDHVLFQVRES
jgi:hypothetical protein